jgi:hypothetical protein
VLPVMLAERFRRLLEALFELSGVLFYSLEVCIYDSVCLCLYYAALRFVVLFFSCLKLHIHSAPCLGGMTSSVKGSGGLRHTFHGTALLRGRRHCTYAGEWGAAPLKSGTGACLPTDL